MAEVKDDILFRQSLIEAIQKACGRNLLSGRYVNLCPPDAPSVWGCCYPAAEALWHAYGRSAGYQPHRLKLSDGTTHWFLRNSAGFILDPTAIQYNFLLDYSTAKPAAFLTQKPSKRAQYILDKISWSG